VGVVNDSGVIMSSTPLYDFCDPEQRVQWLDIVIALMEYLRSGNSRVGFLNKDVVKNMLHKDVEVQMEIEDKNSEEIEKEPEGNWDIG
jgi:hypothetical protein